MLIETTYYTIDSEEYTEFDSDNAVRFFIEDKEFIHTLKLPSKLTDYDYIPGSNRRFISTFIHEFTVKDKITGEEIITFSIDSDTYAEISNYLFDIGVKTLAIRDNEIKPDIIVNLSKPIAYRDTYLKGHRNRCVLVVRVDLNPMYKGYRPILVIDFHDQSEIPGSKLASLALPIITDENAYGNFIENLNNIIEATEDNIMRTMYD